MGVLDEWEMLEDAVNRVGKSKRTLYRWADRGLVRTWRPGDELWFNVEDLLRTKRDMRRLRKTRRERELQ